MRWLRISLAGVVAVALAGCRTRSPQLPVTSAPPGLFPIGLYCVDNTNDFPAVRAAGFNVITGPAAREFLDAAQVNGLQVLARPDTEAGAKFAPGHARRAVENFDTHPALWAWYLVDEPDLNLISPEQVRRARDCVKSAAATKPTTLVLFNGHSAPDYAVIPDIVMIDRYPIPWLPLANFGQHVGLTRAATPAHKPLVAVIQAFDWNTDRKSLPDVADTPLRPPTYEELRCMTYEARARGANGLFYFAYDTGSWKMREHPQTWNGLKRVVAEVNERGPLFQAKQVWWPREHHFGDPEHRFNAALESSVTSCLLRVNPGNAAVPAGDYILAVNNTEQSQTYQFTLPPDIHGQKDWKLRVLGENRELEARENWVTDEFGPYAVHVYQLHN